MIEKINFRDQVKELLLKKMRQGIINPEKSISLASLARELDVSVTPIREALTQLQTSGIVEAIPNRGFFIPELNSSEAENLYELVVSLESLAIRNSSFSDKIIKKLEASNRVFKNAKDEIQRINADIDFHNVLTSNYKNPMALKILADLKTRIFFYEVEFMSKIENYSNSDTEHEQIIDHIKNNNLEKACEVLKDNWIKVLKLQ
ncbi:GntR family transcriptional regulator [Winogradskyella flava]|uniref:GntR family transcriptional regulator n=1 Tax=Winogradskyella flava TaxID=1884876 RepID=UPI0024926409|nr:GntR family transcriptional regulator [Winogradskyella flava]